MEKLKKSVKIILISVISAICVVGIVLGCVFVRPDKISEFEKKMLENELSGDDAKDSINLLAENVNNLYLQNSVVAYSSFDSLPYSGVCTDEELVKMGKSYFIFNNGGEEDQFAIFKKKSSGNGFDVVVLTDKTNGFVKANATGADVIKYNDNYAVLESIFPTQEESYYSTSIFSIIYIGDGNPVEVYSFDANGEYYIKSENIVLQNDFCTFSLSYNPTETGYDLLVKLVPFNGNDLISSNNILDITTTLNSEKLYYLGSDCNYYFIFCIDRLYIAFLKDSKFYLYDEIATDNDTFDVMAFSDKLIIQKRTSRTVKTSESIVIEESNNQTTYETYEYKILTIKDGELVANKFDLYSNYGKISLVKDLEGGFAFVSEQKVIDNVLQDSYLNLYYNEDLNVILKYESNKAYETINFMYDGLFGTDYSVYKNKNNSISFLKDFSYSEKNYTLKKYTENGILIRDNLGFIKLLSPQGIINENDYYLTELKIFSDEKGLLFDGSDYYIFDINENTFLKIENKFSNDDIAVLESNIDVFVVNEDDKKVLYNLNKQKLCSFDNYTINSNLTDSSVIVFFKDGNIVYSLIVYGRKLSFNTKIVDKGVESYNYASVENDVTPYDTSGSYNILDSNDNQIGKLKTDSDYVGHMFDWGAHNETITITMNGGYELARTEYLYLKFSGEYKLILHDYGGDNFTIEANGISYDSSSVSVNWDTANGSLYQYKEIIIKLNHTWYLNTDMTSKDQKLSGKKLTQTVYYKCLPEEDNDYTSRQPLSSYGDPVFLFSFSGASSGTYELPSGLKIKGGHLSGWRYNSSNTGDLSGGKTYVNDLDSKDNNTFYMRWNGSFDTYIFAYYAADTYTVVFDSNLKSGDELAQDCTESYATLTYATSISKTRVTVLKSRCYIFNGYYTGSTGGTQIYKANGYIKKGIDYKFCNLDNGKITYLYAHWVENTNLYLEFDYGEYNSGNTVGYTKSLELSTLKNVDSGVEAYCKTTCKTLTSSSEFSEKFTYFSSTANNLQYLNTTPFNSTDFFSYRDNYLFHSAQSFGDEITGWLIKLNDKFKYIFYIKEKKEGFYDISDVNDLGDLIDGKEISQTNISLMSYINTLPYNTEDKYTIKLYAFYEPRSYNIRLSSVDVNGVTPVTDKVNTTDFNLTTYNCKYKYKLSSISNVFDEINGTLSSNAVEQNVYLSKSFSYTINLENDSTVNGAYAIGLIEISKYAVYTKIESTYTYSTGTVYIYFNISGNTISIDANNGCYFNSEKLLYEGEIVHSSGKTGIMENETSNQIKIHIESINKVTLTVSNCSYPAATFGGTIDSTTVNSNGAYGFEIKTYAVPCTKTYKEKEEEGSISYYNAKMSFKSSDGSDATDSDYDAEKSNGYIVVPVNITNNETTYDLWVNGRNYTKTINAKFIEDHKNSQSISNIEYPYNCRGATNQTANFYIDKYSSSGYVAYFDANNNKNGKYVISSYGNTDLYVIVPKHGETYVSSNSSEMVSTSSKVSPCYELLTYVSKLQIGNCVINFNKPLKASVDEKLDDVLVGKTYDGDITFDVESYSGAQSFDLKDRVAPFKDTFIYKGVTYTLLDISYGSKSGGCIGLSVKIGTGEYSYHIYFAKNVLTGEYIYFIVGLGNTNGCSPTSYYEITTTFSKINSKINISAQTKTEEDSKGYESTSSNTIGLTSKYANKNTNFSTLFDDSLTNTTGTSAISVNTSGRVKNTTITTNPADAYLLRFTPKEGYLIDSASVVTYAYVFSIKAGNNYYTDVAGAQKVNDLTKMKLGTTYYCDNPEYTTNNGKAKVIKIIDGATTYYTKENGSYVEYKEGKTNFEVNKLYYEKITLFSAVLERTNVGVSGNSNMSYTGNDGTKDDTFSYYHSISGGESNLIQYSVSNYVKFNTKNSTHTNKVATIGSYQVGFYYTTKIYSSSDGGDMGKWSNQNNNNRFESLFFLISDFYDDIYIDIKTVSCFEIVFEDIDDNLKLRNTGNVSEIVNHVDTDSGNQLGRLSIAYNNSGNWVQFSDSNLDSTNNDRTLVLSFGGTKTLSNISHLIFFGYANFFSKGFAIHATDANYSYTFENPHLYSNTTANPFTSSAIDNTNNKSLKVYNTSTDKYLYLEVKNIQNSGAKSIYDLFNLNTSTSTNAIATAYNNTSSVTNRNILSYKYAFILKVNENKTTVTAESRLKVTDTESQVDNPTTKVNTWFNDVAVTNIDFTAPYIRSNVIDSVTSNYQSTSKKNWQEYADGGKYQVETFGYGYHFRYYEIPGYYLDKIVLDFDNKSLFNGLGKITINVSGLNGNVFKDTYMGSYIDFQDRNYYYYYNDTYASNDKFSYYLTYNNTDKENSYFDIYIYNNELDKENNKQSVTINNDGIEDKTNVRKVGGTYSNTGTVFNKIVDSLAVVSCNFKVEIHSSPYKIQVKYNTNISSAVSAGKMTSSSTLYQSQSGLGTIGNQYYQYFTYDRLDRIALSLAMTGYTFVGWASEYYYDDDGKKIDSRYDSGNNTWNSSSTWKSITSETNNNNYFSYKNRSNLIGLDEKTYKSSEFYVDGGYFMTDNGLSVANSNRNGGSYKTESYNFWLSYADKFMAYMGRYTNEITTGSIPDITRNGVIELFAIWKVNTYVVSLNINDPDATVSTTTTYLSNNKSLSSSFDILDGDRGFNSGIYLPTLSSNSGFTYHSQTYYCYVQFDTNDWYVLTDNNGLYSKNSGITNTTNKVSLRTFVIDRYGYSWLGWFSLKLSEVFQVDQTNYYKNLDSDKYISIAEQVAVTNPNYVSTTEKYVYNSVETYKNKDFITFNFTNYKNVFNGRSEYTSTGGSEVSNNYSDYIRDGSNSSIVNKYNLFKFNEKYENSDSNLENSNIKEIYQTHFNYYNEENEYNHLGVIVESSSGVRVINGLKVAYNRNLRAVTSSSKNDSGLSTNGYFYYYKSAKLEDDELGEVNFNDKNYNRGIDFLNSQQSKNNTTLKDGEYTVNVIYYDTALNYYFNNFNDGTNTYGFYWGNHNGVQSFRYLTLYSYWETNLYNVIIDFMDNDSKVDAINFDYGSTSVDKNVSPSTVLGDYEFLPVYFNDSEFANRLYKYNPTRVGYDFTGWSFKAEGDNINGYTFTKSNEYTLKGSNPVIKDMLYITKNLWPNNITGTKYNELLGDNKIDGKDEVHYIYMYACWQAQTFTINTSLNIGNIGEGVIKNLYDIDSEFALSFYNNNGTGNDYAGGYSGIKSSYLKQNTNTAYKQDAYTDISANILFEITFDQPLSSARIKINDKYYAIDRLFATSAGEYFLGWFFNEGMSGWFDEDNPNGVVVSNTLKSSFDTEMSLISCVPDGEPNGSVQFFAENTKFDITLYNNLNVTSLDIKYDGNLQQFKQILKNSGTVDVTTEQSNYNVDEYSASGNGKYTTQKLTAVDKNQTLKYSTIDGEYNGTKFYTTLDYSRSGSTNFGYIIETDGNNITRYCICVDSSGQMYYYDVKQGKNVNIYPYVYLDGGNGKKSAYIGNRETNGLTKFTYDSNNFYIDGYVVRFFDTDNIIYYDSATDGYCVYGGFGDSITETNYFYDNISGGYFNVTGTSALDNISNAYYINNSYDNNEINCLVIKFAKECSIITDGGVFKANVTDPLKFNFEKTREFTIYAGWETKTDLNISVSNGNNTGSTSNNNRGLAGYYEIYNYNLTENDSVKEETTTLKTKTTEAINVNGQGDRQSTIDYTYNFYDSLYLFAMPYYDGRFLSEMKITFYSYEQIKLNSSDPRASGNIHVVRYSKVTYELLLKFRWNSAKHIVELSSYTLTRTGTTSEDTAYATTEGIKTLVSATISKENPNGNPTFTIDGGYIKNSIGDSDLMSNELSVTDMSILSFIDQELFVDSDDELNSNYGFMQISSYLTELFKTDSDTDGRIDLNTIKMKFNNLMSSMKIDFKFSVQTYDLQIYNIFDSQGNNLVQDESTNKYKIETSVHPNITDLMKDAKSAYSSGDLTYSIPTSATSTKLYLGNKIATISQNCASSITEYGVPYGTYIYGQYHNESVRPVDVEYDSVTRTGYNTSIYTGYDYIFVDGNYKYGEGSYGTIKALGTAGVAGYNKLNAQCYTVLGAKNLFVNSLRESSALYTFTSWYQKVGDNLYVEYAVDKEKTAIMTDMVIIGYYYANNNPTSIKFYTWNDNQKSYEEYTNNVSEYTSQGTVSSTKFRTSFGEIIKNGDVTTDTSGRVYINSSQSYGVDVTDFETNGKYTIGELDPTIPENVSFVTNNLIRNYWFYESYSTLMYYNSSGSKKYIYYDADGTDSKFYYKNGSNKVYVQLFTLSKSLTDEKTLSIYMYEINGSNPKITFPDEVSEGQDVKTFSGYLSDPAYSGKFKEITLEKDYSVLKGDATSDDSDILTGSNMYAYFNKNGANQNDIEKYYPIYKIENLKESMTDAQLKNLGILNENGTYNARFYVDIDGTRYYLVGCSSDNNYASNLYTIEEIGSTYTFVKSSVPGKTQANIKNIDNYFFCVNDKYYPVQMTKLYSNGSLYYSPYTRDNTCQYEDNTFYFDYKTKAFYYDQNFKTKVTKKSLNKLEFSVYTPVNDNYTLIFDTENSGNIWKFKGYNIKSLPSQNIGYWYTGEYYDYAGYINLRQSDITYLSSTIVGTSFNYTDVYDIYQEEGENKLLFRNERIYDVFETYLSHVKGNEENYDEIIALLKRYCEGYGLEQMQKSFITVDKFYTSITSNVVTAVDILIPVTFEFSGEGFTAFKLTLTVKYHIGLVSDSTNIDENVYAFPIYSKNSIEFNADSVSKSTTKVTIDSDKMYNTFFRIEGNIDTHYYNKINGNMLKFVILDETKFNLLIKQNNNSGQLTSLIDKYSIPTYTQVDSSNLIELDFAGRTNGTYYVVAYYEKVVHSESTDSNYSIRISDNFVKVTTTSENGTIASIEKATVNDNGQIVSESFSQIIED